MKATVLLRVFVVSIFALFPRASQAQQRPGVEERPRIGLALGGGGSRGAVHVGVLRVLERLNVPIDYIAGTSMGAIVGGLYASGLTADEIEHALHDVAWDRVLGNKPDRRILEYRRKQADLNLLVKFELGFGGGRFRLPAGVIEPQRPNLLLKLMTLRAARVTSFDELPIPFRAVATDLGTGDMVVLDRGNLAEAILASMSIPGVFAPVRRDGLLLIDGGVARNLPIDVVRDMGADIIIAVDAGTPLASPESLVSAVDVYAQMLTIFTRANTDTQIKSVQADDVLLAPDLGNIRTMDFSRLDQAIAAGVAAAESVAPRLATFSLPPEYYTRLRSRLRVLSVPDTIDFIRIDNPTRVRSSVVEGRLTIHAGDALDTDRLADAISRVHGIGTFEKVDFEIVDEDGRTGIIIRLADKPWGPGYLRFGLGLTDEPDGNSTFDLRAGFDLTGVNRYGADVRAELRAGETRGLSVEFFQPVDQRGRFFVAPAMGIQQTLADATTGGVTIAQYDSERRYARLDIGRQFGTTGQIRIGIERRAIDARPEIGDPDLPRFRLTQTAFRARFDVDRLDDVYFPGRGTLLSVVAEHVRQADTLSAFDRMEVRAFKAISFGPHTVVAGLDLGTSFGSAVPLYEEFEIGGFLRLSGLRRRQTAGRYLGLGRIVYMNRVGDAVGLSVAGGLRIGGSIEIGNAWGQPPTVAIDQFSAGGSVFAGLETVLGPVYVAWGMADRGRRAWYFFLGQAL